MKLVKQCLGIMANNLIDLYSMVLFTMLGGSLALIPIYLLKLILNNEESKMDDG